MTVTSYGMPIFLNEILPPNVIYEEKQTDPRDIANINVYIWQILPINTTPIYSDKVHWQHYIGLTENYTGVACGWSQFYQQNVLYFAGG